MSKASDNEISDARSTLDLLAGEGDAVIAAMLLLKTKNSNAEFENAYTLQPTNTAKAKLAEIADVTRDGWVGRELLPYVPAGMVGSKQLMFEKLDNVPMLRSIADEISDPASLGLYDPKRTSLSSVSLTAIQASYGRKSNFVLIQRFGQVVATSKRRTGFLLKKGVIDTPKDGDLVLFSNDISALIVGDFVYFRNCEEFQKLFGFLAVIQAAAVKTFDEVTKNLRIDGIDEMRAAAIGSPQMLGKMASIQRKIDGYKPYKKAMTMTKLLAFVQGHPNCGVKVVKKRSSAYFQFESDPEHRFKILKLLDDDYLKSDLTTMEYEANSKGNPLA